MSDDPLTKYIEEKDTLGLRLASNYIKNFFLKNIPNCIYTYKNVFNIYRKRGLEVYDLLSRIEDDDTCDISKLKGLEWIGNSCYLDSTLFALLCNESEFIHKYILDTPLKIRDNAREIKCNVNANDIEGDITIIDWVNRTKIQEQLKYIYNHITNGGENDSYKCTNLRNVLKLCPGARLFQGEDIAESGEFLRFILSLFETNVAVVNFTTYATSSLTENPSFRDLVKTSAILHDNASVIHYIETSQIMKTPQNLYYELRSFIRYKDDSGILTDDNLFLFEGRKYKRRIRVVELVDTPYLIFEIGRFFGEGVFYRTKIIPNEIITLNNMKSFCLSSIVVFSNSGAHYTCYFRCGNIYYYYNDIESSFEKIGNYNDLLMVNKGPNPITNGVLYYYTPYDNKKFKNMGENRVEKDFVNFFLELNDENRIIEVECSESESSSESESE